jgi:uncharacterized protein
VFTGALAMIALSALASVAAPAALHAAAESSGWSSKVEVPEAPTDLRPKVPAPPAAAKSAPKAAPGPAKAATPPADPKRVPAPAKSTQPAAPSGALASPAKIPALPTALPPPTGETAAAAYELFDQGRYLSALSTAVKAVQKGGETEAYTLIGRIYEEGLGVGRNAEVAVEWYAQGAELGDLNAQFALGLMYAEGRGTAKNLSRAAAAFEAAAKQNHPVAQYNLGMIYAHGDGRDEDFTQAAHWLEKAAAQGHAPAQYDLATLYYEGRGVALDEKIAAAWLRKAADAGMPTAQLDYARMLVKLEGVEREPDDPKNAKNELKAFNYIRLAAEKGNVVAQNRLARFYFFGVVIEGNVIEGAKWHLLSRAGGVSDLALDNLLSKMPPEDRKKAEKAAGDWSARVAQE